MLIFKVFLLIVFTMALICQIIYTYLTVRFFKEQITPHSTRSEIQIIRTHGHFFILSGLWSSVVLLIGIWAILSEYVGVLLGYVFMSSAGIIFQVMGSLGSDDVQVAKLKVIGALLDPMLIFLSLFFAHLIRQSNNTLFALPIYRKSVVESRRSSFSEIINGGADGEILSPGAPGSKPFGSRSSGSTSLSSRNSTTGGGSTSSDFNQNHIHHYIHHHHNHCLPVPSMINENIFYARNPSLHY